MEKGNAVKNLIKKNQLMITALAIMIAIAGYLQFAGTNLEKEYLAADDADTLSAVDSTDIVTDMESLDSDMDIVMEDYLEEDMQVAEATPEGKLAMIRDFQTKGHLVAMTGDGTNDAPALAQADVAVAMNSGTQAAKEAGNMVDLDSNPTKLIEVVHIGKQMLMTRGSLTTFSIANDVAKYFAIIPAAFAATYPQLNALNVMHLHSPASAILSAVIFNALIIVFLIPLALKGVSYKPLTAAAMLRRNLWIYGLGGLVVPFIGIKVIDMLLTLFGLV